MPDVGTSSSLRRALDAAYRASHVDAAIADVLAYAHALIAAHHVHVAVEELEYALAWTAARGASDSARAPLHGLLASLYQRLGDARRAARAWSMVTE